MSILIGYLDGNETTRIHINDYKKEEHGDRVKCAYGHELMGKQGLKMTWHFSHTSAYDNDCSKKMGSWHVWWQNRVEPDFLEVIMYEAPGILHPQGGANSATQLNSITTSTNSRHQTHNDDSCAAAGSAKKHIADMVSGDDIVIEFQKSIVPQETIIEREDFYGNMIWVFCCVKHNHEILDQAGRFVKLQLLSGSQYFLDARKPSFLDFDLRGLIEVLKIDRSKKSRPVIYGKIWTLQEFDDEYMKGCLKENADTRIHRQPYAVIGKCDNFGDFLVLQKQKNRKN